MLDNTAPPESFKDKLSFLKEFKKPKILKLTLLFGGQFLSSFVTAFTMFFAVNDIGVSYGVDFVIFGASIMLLIVPMGRLTNT